MSNHNPLECSFHERMKDPEYRAMSKRIADAWSKRRTENPDCKCTMCVVDRQYSKGTLGPDIGFGWYEKV